MVIRSASFVISHSNGSTGHSMPLVAHAQNLRTYCAKLRYNPQYFLLIGLLGPPTKFTTVRSLPLKNPLKKSFQSGKVVVSKIISHLALPERALKSLYVVHFGSCVNDKRYYLEHIVRLSIPDS